MASFGCNRKNDVDSIHSASTTTSVGCLSNSYSKNQIALIVLGDSSQECWELGFPAAFSKGGKKEKKLVGFARAVPAHRLLV